MSSDTILDVVALILSCFAIGLTIYFSIKAKRSTDENLAIQKFNVIQLYRSKVINWANEVLAVMSECVTICELDPTRAPDFFGRRNHLRTRLSELIDRGRWFFENDKSTGYGQWKQGAYQGIAPETIDCIKEVLCHVEKLNYREIDSNPSQRQSIVDQKRKFTSEIQEFAEPKKALEDLEKLLGLS